jgi:hypothetical protein
MLKCPCVPECEKRTATCKFDGTCDGYQNWFAVHNAERQERYEKEKALLDVRYIEELRTKRYQKVKSKSRRATHSDYSGE